jgi:hypothetical protein
MCCGQSGNSGMKHVLNKKMFEILVMIYVIGLGVKLFERVENEVFKTAQGWRLGVPRLRVDDGDEI